jgi:hypothetical protein
LGVAASPYQKDKYQHIRDDVRQKPHIGREQRIDPRQLCIVQRLEIQQSADYIEVQLQKVIPDYHFDRLVRNYQYRSQQPNFDGLFTRQA